MRAGGPAGLADKADGVALADARAAAHRDAAEMRIHGRVLAVVAQDDDVAVAALHSRVFDERIADRAHAGTDRSGIVDTLVGAPGALDRMPAHAEARAHAREFERRAQERLAQVLAVGRVVARAEVHRAQ